ncbi:hypothetical protein GCM10011504_19930 [Siccirubricoccus deserti]|nr:hypothetical protein GCM10011504_19930 [Siccirubricoccus deserti]
MALAEAVAGLGPGWVALEGCLLPEEGAAPAGRIRHALLHPSAGIVLLELAPGDIAPDAAGRLGWLLDAAGFTQRFGGLPPILHLRLPQRMLPTLGWVIEKQFGRRPALAVAGGSAWVGAAQQALAGAVLPPPPAVPVEPVGPGGGWQGGRLLAGIWGGLVLLVGSVVLILQLLGPPEPDADFAALVPLPATLPKPIGGPRPRYPVRSIRQWVRPGRRGQPRSAGRLRQWSLSPCLRQRLRSRRPVQPSPRRRSPCLTG